MNQTFKDIDEAFAWIESFTNLEKKTTERKRYYRPERMAEILDHFDNPHLGCKVIHTAGSKGKGSTSVLLASALTRSGKKTGLYTSPHVLHYRERIQINCSPLEDKKYIEGIAVIKNRIDMELPGGAEPTTFELLTLLAFMLFEKEGCDICVIETGLGGRLDATNAVKPEASVLTPIELEHTQWLGNTLEIIAAEKAGIIKEKAPVFSAPQSPEVESVFRNKSREMGTSFQILSDHVKNIESTVSSEGTEFTIDYTDGSSVSGSLALTGHIQAWNAALALFVLTSLYPEVELSIWLEGIAEASLPGRMEILSKDPLVVLDGSHTPRSVTLALESFRSIANKKNEKALLFACQDDKDAKSMAEILSPYFSKIVITTPGFFKKSNPHRVFNDFSSIKKNCILEEDPKKALKLVEFQNTDLLIIGSFFLAGSVKEIYGVQ